MIMKETGIVATSAVLLTVILSGCDIFGSGNNGRVSRTDRTAEATFSYEFDVVNRNAITINGINGSVTMTGVPGRNTVSINGIRTVGSESTEDAEAFLDELEVQVTESSSDFLVETLQPQDTGGRNLTVDYEIVLPDNFRSTVTQLNGTVSVDSMREELVVEQSNGDIRLRGIRANTYASVVNGNIDSEVTLPDGGALEHSIFNGNIELAIPDTTSADFNAKVDNGEIVLIGLDLANQSITETQVTGVLGSGSGSILLQIINGDIEVIGTQ